MTDFVNAYDRETGEILPHAVPAHWFEIPALSAGISKTPRQKARDNKTPDSPGIKSASAAEGKG